MPVHRVAAGVEQDRPALAAVDGAVQCAAHRRRDWLEIAYLAFTIGMSYAVAEIEPTSTDTRRKAMPHALLSYLFGTVLIAVAINLVTNLGQS